VIDNATVPYGVLLLRLSLGVMFIAHALLKWRVYTISGTAAFFKSVGLPGWFAPLIIAVELCGGACLILGIYPQYVALLLVPLMLGTIVKVHGHNGWLFSNKDGGWEFPAFWTGGFGRHVPARGWRGDPRQVAGAVGRRMLWLRRTSPCRRDIPAEKMSCTEAIVPEAVGARGTNTEVSHSCSFTLGVADKRG